MRRDWKGSLFLALSWFFLATVLLHEPTDLRVHFAVICFLFGIVFLGEPIVVLADWWARKR